MSFFQKISTIDDSNYCSLRQDIKTYSTGPALDSGVQEAVNDFLEVMRIRKEMLSSQAELDKLNKVMDLVNQALRQQLSLDFLPVVLKSQGFIPERHHDYFGFMLQYSKHFSFLVHLMTRISLLLNPNQEINHTLAIFVERMQAYQKMACASEDGIVSYHNADGSQTAIYV